MKLSNIKASAAASMFSEQYWKIIKLKGCDTGSDRRNCSFRRVIHAISSNIQYTFLFASLHTLTDTRRPTSLDPEHVDELLLIRSHYRQEHCDTTADTGDDEKNESEIECYLNFVRLKPIRSLC